MPLPSCRLLSVVVRLHRQFSFLEFTIGSRPCQVLSFLQFLYIGREFSFSVAVGCTVKTLADEIVGGGSLRHIVLALQYLEVLLVHNYQFAVIGWHHIISLTVLRMRLVGHHDSSAESEQVTEFVKAFKHNSRVYIVAADTAFLATVIGRFLFTVCGSPIS